MILRQFYRESLGHAAYFIGSEEIGEAPVLDERPIGEWRAGHAPHARHLPGGELSARIDELHCEPPPALMCPAA